MGMQSMGGQLIIIFHTPDSTLVNDGEVINRININSSHRWKTHPYNQFHNKTIGEITNVWFGFWIE